MIATMRKFRSFSFRLAYLMALPLGFIPAITALPAHAYLQNEKEEGIEAAKRSNLFSIPLPEGAFRYRGKELTVPFAEVLKALATEKKAKIGDMEVLVWQGASHPEEALSERLKKAEFEYKAQSSEETEEFKITPFTAISSGAQREILGVWCHKGAMAVMAWTQVTPASKTNASAARPQSSEKPRAAQTPAPATGKTSADMMGAWSWTTISGVNYRDTVTNALAEPSGMSVKFTFSPDGRYTKFFYVRQRTYSLVTQATTTEEGRVTFAQGSFTLHPEKGHYKGNTGSKIVDRPMTEQERKPSTYYWEWRTDQGKQALYMGPTLTSLSRFTKQ
jgi:hypothetical protein